MKSDESSVQRCIRTVFTLGEWDFLTDQPAFMTEFAQVQSMEHAETVIALGESMLARLKRPGESDSSLG